MDRYEETSDDECQGTEWINAIVKSQRNFNAADWHCSVVAVSLATGDSIANDSGGGVARHDGVAPHFVLKAVPDLNSDSYSGLVGVSGNIECDRGVGAPGLQLHVLDACAVTQVVEQF